MKLGDFVGTRARFQRLRDSKIYNGWIDQMAGNRVILGLTGTHLPTVGDEYRIEGFGHLVSVVFLAKLENTFSVEDQKTVDQAGNDVRLDFLVASAVRMVESNETVRYKLKNVAVQVKSGEKIVPCLAIDASFSGIGLRCPEKMEPSCEVAMVVSTPLGNIVVTAVCKHCREDADEPGTFRAGFQFNEFGRVDRPKWERFITNLR